MSSGDISSCCKAPTLEIEVGLFICGGCDNYCSLVNPENHKEER